MSKYKNNYNTYTTSAKDKSNSDNNSGRINYVRIFILFLNRIKSATKQAKYSLGLLLALLIVVGTGVFWTSALKLNTTTVEIYPEQFSIYSNTETEDNWSNGLYLLERDLEEDAVVDDFTSDNSAFIGLENNEEESATETTKNNIEFSYSRTIQVNDFSLEAIKEELENRENKVALDIVDLRLFLSMASFPGIDDKNRIYIEASLPGKKKHAIASIEQNSYLSNNLNDGYFVYPLEALFDGSGEGLRASDIEKLDISITATSSSGVFVPIYVDAVWLEMDYKIEPLSPSRPKVKLKKGNHVQVAKSSFSADEGIDFVFSNPQYTFSEIKNKAQNGEIEVVEDKLYKLSDKNPVLEILKKNREESSDQWGPENEPPGYESPFENNKNNTVEEKNKDAEDSETNNNNDSSESASGDGTSGTDVPTDNLEEGTSADPEVVVPTGGVGEEKSEPQSSQDPDPGAQDQDPGVGTDNTTKEDTSNSEEPVEKPSDPSTTEEEKVTGEEVLSILRQYFFNVAYAQQVGVLEDFDLFLVSPTGTRTGVEASVVKKIENGEEIFTASIEKPSRNFVPGLYTLEVELHTRESIVVLQQDFTWGVLALNVNKSIYDIEDEESYIQMGVLNESGHTICDADLELKILSPSFSIETLSTDEGTIIYGEECSGNNYIETPDYYAYYNLPGEIGEYEVELTATTDNGVHSIVDQFKVAESALFDVERIGPTRIFPLESYEMVMRITANQDFSGNIVEYVPSGFKIKEVTDYGLQITDLENVIKLSWENVSLNAGDSIDLVYEFDAPNVSPEFYLLGPLEFLHPQEAIGNRLIFEESRQWQIANDAILPTILVDGDGAGPRNWSSQAFGDISEGISAADGVEIAAATTNENRNASLDTSFTLGNTPIDFQTMDDISYNVRYRANSNTGDDSLTFGIRIVSGATILAAADAGGTFQTVQSGQNSTWSTTPGNSTPTLFTYINTTAGKAVWDAAEVEFRSTHSQNMGPEDNFVIVDTVEFTGNYTTAGVSLSGILYSDEGTSAVTSCGTCTVKVVNSTTGDTATDADGTDGSGVWNITGFAVPSDGDDLTIWVDGDATYDATLVVKYGTACGNSPDCNDLNLYQDRVIIRNDDIAASVTSADLQDCDNDSGTNCGDTEIGFTYNGSNLILDDERELHIWTGDTFAPGSTIQTSVDDGVSGKATDGDIHIGTSATLDMATNALSVGGGFNNEGTYSKTAPQATTFTATTTGHSITTSTSDFDDVIFNGSGGGWSFSATDTVEGDLTMTAGTLSGTNNLNINGGNVTGDGDINLTGGTFTLDGAGNFGGSTEWNFNNLTFGGVTTETTTSTGTGGIVVGSILTIESDQTLDAGSKIWTLSGTGIPFVINGTFTANSSTFDYTGAGLTEIAATTYNNIESSPAAAVTHRLGTASSQNISVNGNLVVGTGSDAVLLDVNNYDPTLTITGSVTINSQAELSASATGTFQVAGSWTNSGTFTHNSGSITFNAGSGSVNIDSTGATLDNFNNIEFNDGGGSATFLLESILDVDGNLSINNGTLDVNSLENNTITVRGNWANNDIFEAQNGNVVLAGTTSTTLDSGCTAYNDCANGNFYDLEINKTDGTDANDNVSLSITDINVASTLTITDGELVQGTLNVQIEGATTSVSINAAGEWYNDSTGNLYLDGDFINNGIATFNANGLSCGDADSITITNITNIPDWDGTGTFSIKDVTISNQNAVASITVEDSTNNGGNTGNWTFTGCSITISGDVLQGDEATFVGDPPCDGTTSTVSLRINGGTEQTTTCDLSNGYSFTGLFPSAGDTITVYLNSNSTPKANLVLVATSSDTLNADLYQDTVIIRDEDDGAASISDMIDWDSSSDATNMLFDAVSGTPDTLSVNSGVELHVWTGDTFNPGGTVTAQGDVHVDNSATMYIDDASSVISGDLLVDDSATFQVQQNISINGGDITTSGSGVNINYTNTPTINISGTGSIGGGTSPTINFYNLTVSGTQSITSDIIVSNDITVDGTMDGSSNVTVSGNIAGTGTVNMSGGTVEQRVAATKNFGTTSSANNWTFNNLTFSNDDGGGVAHNIATDTGGTGTITVNGILEIGKSGDVAGSTTTLDAGNRTWTLAGTSGDPFQILDSPAGALNGQTSTFEYTAVNGAGDVNIEDASYNNLTIGGASAENYNPTEGAITASGDLTVDTNATLIGTNNVTVNGSVIGAGAINLTGGTFEQRIAAAENFGSTGGTSNWVFNNLIISNSDSVDHTVTADTGGTGEIQVNGTFTVSQGSDTNNTNFNNESNDRILNVNHVVVGIRGMLSASSTASFTVSGNWTNDGTLNEGTGTIEFDGTTSAQVDSGCGSFDTCTNENFYDIRINKTAGTDADDNVSLINTGIRVTNTIFIDDGELVQGALNIRAEGSTAVSIATGVGAKWTNNSTGDLTLGGGFNAGDAVITFQGGGASCGGFDSILIRSTDGVTQRAWSDSGATFNFNDVDVSDQAGTSSITVEDGTDQGDNGANWTFVGCPGSGSSTYSMRPDGDTATVNWGVVGSTCAGAHWCTVNDNVDDPTAASFTERIETSGNNTTDRFTTASPTDVSTATQIIPKVHTDALGGNNNMRVQLAVFINGTQVGTTFNCANSTATATWCSGTPITGSWTQADIDTLEIAVTSNKNGGGAGDTLRISATYAELTYTPTGITIEGNVYEDEATTALVACDDATNMIAIQIGASSYGPTTCAGADGFFSINAITQPATGTPIFIYIDGATCGGDNVNNSCGTTVIRYGGSGNINNAVLRKSRLLLRHDDGGPITNSDLSGWDNVDDTDIVYDVDGSNNLTTEDNVKLIVNIANTFTPGANVVTDSSGDNTSTDGDILIDTSGVLNIEANSLSVGGDFVNSGTFNKSAGQTTTFTATATGHSITEGGNNFDNIVINGTGGGWSFADSTITDGDITVTNGTLSGSVNITVNGGDITGAGTINMTGGTVTITNSDGVNDLGGGSYTFNNLTIGDSDATPETTALSGNITVNSVLTVDPVSDATNDTLNSGSSTITLAGSGTPFIINGVFDENTGRVDYTGTSATNITAATYYNLESSPAASVTHTLGTAGGQTITVTNNLDIGDTSNAVVLDADNYDPALNINGNININTGAEFSASATGTLQVAQNFTNNGTFTSNGGNITFDSASNSTIAGDGTIFSDFTSTTAGKNLIFTAGETFRINGLLTLADVSVNSTDTVTPTQWIINHQGTESISATTVTNSACDANSTNIDMYTSGDNTNGGNNDLCWQFAPYAPQSQNWQWFDDENNETPTTSLATENTAPSNINNGEVLKLRFTINETGGWTGSNVKFKIQFSTASDFSSGVTDVEEIGSCTGSSEWCYADGTADADNDPITTRVLSDSTANGTHNESGVSATTFDHSANTATEFEFTIAQSGASPNVTYFFRAWDSFNNAAVPLNTGENYPSLTTGGTTLTLTIDGLPTSTTTESITTDIGTTSISIPFGEVTFGSDVKAAQRITVDTNASSGYSLFMYQRSALGSANGSVFDPITGTNASPTVWSPTGCTTTAASCYGYHTSDTVLSGGSTRFSADDTYARFNTSAEEVAFSSTSASNETHDIVYRLKATNLQEAGEYSTNIVYIIVPVF